MQYDLMNETDLDFGIDFGRILIAEWPIAVQVKQVTVHFQTEMMWQVPIQYMIQE